MLTGLSKHWFILALRQCSMMPERVFPARPKIGWSPCPLSFSRSHTARVISQPLMGSILQSVIVRSNTGTVSSLMASAVLPSSQDTTSCPRSASLWPINSRQAALPSTICIFNLCSDGNRGSDEVRRLAYDCFFSQLSSDFIERNNKTYITCLLAI